MRPGETSVGPPGSPRFPQFQGFAKGVEGIRQTAVLQTEIALDLGSGDGKFPLGPSQRDIRLYWRMLQVDHGGCDHIYIYNYIYMYCIYIYTVYIYILWICWGFDWL